MQNFKPNPRLRGLFMGSGSDGLSELSICTEIIRLTDKAAADVNVLYLGTATYDLPGPKKKQTERFGEAGCRVTFLDVATQTPTPEEIKRKITSADALLVSGGNTLFAVDRWIKLGIDDLLRQVAERQAVMCGGSAGAICWFDGGHSDSMDPDSYKKAKLALTATDNVRDDSAAPASAAEAKTWKYIRVDGLGLLPGLVCPHYDKTQSNGVLRAVDFDNMMRVHSGETGVCIDHWAALVVEGESYQVIYPEGREGSVKDGAFSAERLGIPGMWIKTVEDGVVTSRLAPYSGHLADVLQVARHIEKDPLVDVCRAENPDDAP